MASSDKFVDLGKQRKAPDGGVLSSIHSASVSGTTVSGTVTDEERLARMFVLPAGRKILSLRLRGHLGTTITANQLRVISRPIGSSAVSGATVDLLYQKTGATGTSAFADHALPTVLNAVNGYDAAREIIVRDFTGTAVGIDTADAGEFLQLELEVIS